MNALFDLCRVHTPTVGTGTLTLGGQVSGYLDFVAAGVPNGAVVSYGIADVGQSETGFGTYNAVAHTLTRSVYRSTGAGNNTPIALSGSAQVFITALAEDFGNQTITLSGDASGSGTTAIPVTLANSGVTAGTFQGLTIDVKGRVTAATNQGYVTSSGVTSITAGTGLTGGTITATGTIALSVPVSVANGGTGSTTAAGAPWLLLTGGTLSGALTVNANVSTSGSYYLAGVTSGAGPRFFGDTTNVAWELGSGNGNFLWYDNTATQRMGLTSGGNLTVTGEIISTNGAGNYGNFRLVGGNYGAILRQDGANLYILLTPSGSPYGAWNALRPFMVNVVNGQVSISHGLFLSGVGDPGGSTTLMSLTGTRIRFPQASGDEASAGLIDYGNINAGALSIVGKGASINNRVVQIYDTLNVQTVNASSAINITGAVNATGSGAGLVFANRNMSNSFLWYALSDWAYLYHTVAGNCFAFTANNFIPAANNTANCGISGTAWSNVTSYAFPNASDRREKQDIDGLPDCLDLVRAINPQRYRWRHGRNQERLNWGFVAQDVEAAMAGAGHEFGGHRVERGRHSLEYNQLTAVLWKAVQELSQQVEELRHGRIV